MRAKSAAYSCAFSLPVVMRQSETRRLRYCQSCSLNSGCERISSKTVVSGLILPITRVYLASDMPRACARARKAATHWSNDDLLACARAVALPIATAAASMDRQARLDRGGFVHSFIAPYPGFLWRWRFYSRFCRLCGRVRGRHNGHGGQRFGGNRRGGDVFFDVLFLDFLATAADQPLIRGHQRHVGVDEDPAVFRRHLQVEVKVVGGGALAPGEVADLADHLALVHEATAHHAVGVELLGQHVQVAEAQALVGRVDHDVKRLLGGGAQHGSIAHGDHVVQIRLAALRPLDALPAEGRADVLPLMTEPSRTLADIEVAGLAEIIPPRIGVILRGRFIQNQRLAVYATAIGPNAAQRSGPGTSGRLAVSPIHEGLGIGERWRVGERETDLGIDRVVGHAAFAPKAGAGEDVAGAVV